MLVIKDWFLHSESVFYVVLKLLNRSTMLESYSAQEKKISLFSQDEIKILAGNKGVG